MTTMFRSIVLPSPAARSSWTVSEPQRAGTRDAVEPAILKLDAGLCGGERHDDRPAENQDAEERPPESGQSPRVMHGRGIIRAIAVR